MQVDYSPPLEKGCAPSFEQTWIPINQWCFESKLVEIGPVILEKKIFKCLWIISAISPIYPLGKESGPSLKQLESLSSKDTVCSLVDIGRVVLGKKMLVIYFGFYIPLEKGVVLHLIKTWISITQGCFVPIWVETHPVVSEKKFF